MRWGDIVLVSLEPVIGSEANKTRPAVIVSNNGANKAVLRHHRGVLTVAPITSNVDRVYPFQVLIEDDEDLQTAGLDKVCKIQAEQVRAIDIRRIVKQLGRLPSDQRGYLCDALSLHLSL